MDISLRFREFLLSILASMSQLIPPSSHTPPTEPQPSQTTDPEAPPVTTVVAKQNIELRNPQWQDIIMGFCFTSALQIALQYTKTPSQLPLSFHLLSLTVVLTFSALFVAKIISSKYPVSAQVVDEVAVFFVTTAFFLAITIPMPLCLKFLTSDTVLFGGNSVLLGIYKL
ncbi:hypothetical protein CFP56_010996 [Quercus suber]|uniref:MARVEL domain-containing protein n=1 Tax=Quercus suber TaxID=58331 RepID=A0AAW0KZG7_QUESU